MSTISFTATADFTPEQVADFALAKGWKEDSEISAIDFVTDIIKKQIVHIVGAPTRDKIIKEHQSLQKAALDQYLTELDSAINVISQ